MQHIYLGHLLQAPQHKTVVADGGAQEFGDQAKADVQGQLLFESQALGIEEGPVIWGESTRGRAGRGCSAEGMQMEFHKRNAPQHPPAEGRPAPEPTMGRDQGFCHPWKLCFLGHSTSWFTPCTRWSRDIQ